MRKVLITLVVLIIVVAALLGYAVYNIDSLIGPYKDEIIAQAEQQTGRKIKLANVNVNIWGGIGVRLQDFSISEDPAFGSGDFVQAKNLQVNVKFLPLLRQEIEVSRIILNDPVINLVRNQGGVFNFASLSSPQSATESKPTPSPTGKQQQETKRSTTPKPSQTETLPEKSPGTGTGSSPAPPLQLVVSRLEISDGQLKYTDKKDNSNLELKQLDLTVEDFSFNNPFRVLLAVAVLESKQNLNLDGMVGPIGSPPKPDAIPINAKINITALSFDSLQKALPEIKKQMPKELTLSGGMEARDFTVKRAGSELTVAGTLDLTRTGFKFGNTINKPEGTALRITADANATPKSIAVKNIDLTFNTWKLNGKGSVGLGQPTALDLRFDTTLTDLQAWDKLVPLLKDYQLTGGMQAKSFVVKGNLNALTVAGTLDLTGTGFKFGNTINKPEGTALRVTTDADVSSKNVAVRNLALTFNTLQLKGKGDVGLGKQTALDLTFDVAPMELQGWEKIVPLLEDYQLMGKIAANATVKGNVGGGAAPDIKGKATLEKLTAKAPGLTKPVEDLSATIDFSGKSATLQQTSLRVGKTRMNAKAEVQSFSPLALTYEFSSPEVWLADFQPRSEDEVLKDVKSVGRLTSDKGLSFESNVTSSQGSVAKLNYTDFRTDVDLKDPWLTIKTVQLKALKGTINAKGKMQIKGESPEFSFDSQIKGVDIKEYTAGTPGMPKFEGLINADVIASGRGKDWQAMKPTIKGKGQAEVANGKLFDFNIAEQVLEGITGIPGLTALISGRIKDKYPQIFKGETTEFEQLNTVFNAADGKANIEQLNMKARDYGMTGKGWIDFDGKTEVASVLTLSKDLSTDLAGAAGPAKYLANDKGQMEIPFVLAGIMPKVRPSPDLSHLGGLLQKNLVNKLAERFIPGMDKSSDKGATGDAATGSGEKSESKGIMGMAEQMIPGLGGASTSKSSTAKVPEPETAKPSATAGESAPQSEPKTAAAKPDPVATESKPPEQPKAPEKKPSTEDQVKDAISKGLKLFGQ